MKKRSGERPAAFVYLRAGEQADLGGVRNAGWTPVGRRLVLDALRPSWAGSEVLDEFLDHLKRLDGDVRAIWTLLPNAWQEFHPEPRSRLVWVGLFQQLAPDLDGGGDYVPNPTGGFMGFWWTFLAVPGGSVYLQLEHGSLFAKVDSGNEGDRQKLRDTWMPRVTSIEGPVKFRCAPAGGLDLAATPAVLDAGTASLKAVVAAEAAE